jgi:hypothetical protein
MAIPLSRKRTFNKPESFEKNGCKDQWDARKKINEKQLSMDD